MSGFKVNVRIDEILEVEQGESASGEWAKVSFIGTETEGEYPKPIGFEIFGQEKVDKFLQYNKVGDEAEVSFNLESRLYNGRVYTTARAWKVWNSATTASAAPAPQGNEEEEDDLPF